MYNRGNHWNTHYLYKKLHDNFSETHGYKIIEPNVFSLAKTVAIIKKGSNFIEKKQLILSNYKNRVVELNYKNDTTILGVHMPIKLSDNKDFRRCKKTWQELTEYLKNNIHKKIILAGDFNSSSTCKKPGSFTKEFNDLILQGNLFDTVLNEPTTIYNTPIDHILVSNSLKDFSKAKVDNEIDYSDHYPVKINI